MTRVTFFPCFFTPFFRSHLINVFVPFWLAKRRLKCFLFRSFFRLVFVSAFGTKMMPKWDPKLVRNLSQRHFSTSCFSTCFLIRFSGLKVGPTPFFLESEPVNFLKSYRFYSMDSLWPFLEKIVPRSFSNRFLLQNGSQKAP